MITPIDLGDNTGGYAGRSDEDLNRALAGADTTALDAAADQQWGDYLERWADEIRRAGAE